MHPGTGRKVYGGGWSAENLVFCFGPNLFPSSLSFELGPSRTMIATNSKSMKLRCGTTLGIIENVTNESKGTVIQNR